MSCREAWNRRAAPDALARQDYEPVAGTWCPECGPRVRVDEEGLCVSCGSTAIGNGANKALAALATAPDALVEAWARAKERVRGWFAHRSEALYDKDTWALALSLMDEAMRQELRPESGEGGKG